VLLYVLQQHPKRKSNRFQGRIIVASAALTRLELVPPP
jgi:hypothetical protein